MLSALRMVTMGRVYMYIYQYTFILHIWVLGPLEAYNIVSKPHSELAIMVLGAGTCVDAGGGLARAESFGKRFAAWAPQDPQKVIRLPVIKSPCGNASIVE